MIEEELKEVPIPGNEKMVFDAKLYNKVYEASGKMKKVGKDKKGFNFSYADGLEIRKEINDKIRGMKIFIDAPQWKDEKSVEKEGKSFLIKGTIVIKLYDLETGYHRTYNQFAAQVAVDPMQAKGSCETYAMRQFVKELFDIEVDRTEVDVSREVIIYDKNNVPTKALSSDQITKIVKIMTDITADPTSYKEDVANLLIRYNKLNETNYGQLRKFPDTEFEDLKKHAAAFANEKLKEAQEKSENA